MFARLTFLNIRRESAEDVKRFYNEEVVPIVKSQKGNVGIWLLEPANENDEFVSLTEWMSKADSDMYENSGTYRMLVDKLKDSYTSKPVLKTYNIAENKVMATM
jgi:heme-degrading monooxygenase HmoA